MLNPFFILTSAKAKTTDDKKSIDMIRSDLMT